ncbi:hypothetical protein [Brachyspira pilosicoli]|uniref:hypothetical protein n=1 Tax=Brachyspira pilosicoli TaxID=52584 RepID=UPI0030071345
MNIYKKYDNGIHRIREIFGIKITTKPLENKINNLFSYINKLEKKIDLLDIRNKARMQILALGDKKIIEEKRKERLIVSLTTFPQRIYDIDVVLFSLLNQTVKPDKIVLWLAKEEFPNLEDSVPPHILNMRKFGIEIEFCKDIKSYKKLIYALKKYPNDLIVTADDDAYYQYNWLEKLYNAYLENPNYIHCHRGRIILLDSNKNIVPLINWENNYLTNKYVKPSYRNYFTGLGGVLYKSHFFSDEIYNEDLFMKLAPTEDDKWFFTMALLNGIKINIVKDHINPIEIGYDSYNKLYDINKTGVNYKTFLTLIEYYNLENRIINDQ